MRKTVDKSAIKKWKQELEESIERTSHVSQLGSIIGDSLEQLGDILEDEHLKEGTLCNLIYNTKEKV